MCWLMTNPFQQNDWSICQIKYGNKCISFSLLEINTWRYYNLKECTNIQPIRVVNTYKSSFTVNFSEFALKNGIYINYLTLEILNIMKINKRGVSVYLLKPFFAIIVILVLFAYWRVVHCVQSCQYVPLSFCVILFYICISKLHYMQ